MTKNFKKKATILFLMIIIGGILFYYQNFNREVHPDEAFHYQKTINDCAESGIRCNNYPGAYHRLASFVVQDKNTFLLWNILLFVVLGPLVFYYFTDRNIWSVLFYFIGTNFIFSTFAIGTYPSSLAVLVFLVFFKTKQLLPKSLLFLVGILLHNYSFLLFGLTWIIQLVSEKKKFFPVIIPDLTIFSLWNGIDEFAKGRFIWIYYSTNIFVVVSGVYHFFLESKWVYLSIIGISFFGSTFFERAYFIASFLCTAGFTEYFTKQPNWIKYQLLFVLFCYFVFSAYNYLVVMGAL